jgi:hypothetical protein
MKITVAYHFDPSQHEVWSTPYGLACAFERAGHSVDRFGFEPTRCDLRPLHGSTSDLIFFCLAGPSASFDSEIKILKSVVNQPLFIESGDDLPHSLDHRNRVHHFDAIFTPDKRCNQIYLGLGLKSYWMPCWCDDMIFRNLRLTRQNRCVTTCGDRPFTKSLSSRFGDRFVNRRVMMHDNTEYFNSGTITYQFARWGEITRRLFEAGGCGNAILTNRISSDTGIYDLFEEDVDMAYFDGEKECLEKMERLLLDEVYRTTLANNICNKISSRHLIGHRVDTILNVFSSNQF